MKARLLCIVSTTVALIATSSAVGQSRTNQPQVNPLGEWPLVPQERANLGLIWDLSTSSRYNRSVHTVIENGIKKTTASENGLKAYIEECPGNGLMIKVTRQYGPDEIEKLVDEQPELYMHLQALPTQVGDSQIEYSVGVTTKYEADDATDLKRKHPQAFEVYQKFTEASDLLSPRRMNRLPVPPLFQPPPGRPPEMAPMKPDPADPRNNPADKKKDKDT